MNKTIVIRLIGLILILIGMALILAASAPNRHKDIPKPRQDSIPNPIPETGPPFKYPEPSVHCTKTLDGQDTVSSVHLRPGDTLCVALTGTLSTGYRWEMMPPDTAVIRQMGERETLIPTNLEKGLVGYPEKIVWHFKAVGEGKTTITAVYHRRWEKDKPPARTFKAEIFVGGQ
jgi:predicted secreted protein